MKELFRMATAYQDIMLDWGYNNEEASTLQKKSSPTEWDDLDLPDEFEENGYKTKADSSFAYFSWM